MKAMHTSTTLDQSMEMDSVNGTDDEGRSHVSTRSSYRAWIRSIEAKLHASNAAPTSPSRIGLLETLQKALEQKHQAYLLSSAETRLFSALAAFLLSSSQAGGLISDASVVAQLLQLHSDLTRDSNGSALDIAAFQAYTSLTLALHWIYAGVDPAQVAEKCEPWISQAMSLSWPSSQEGQVEGLGLVSKDPLLYWTATSGGPRLDATGNYLQSSLPRIPTAQQAEAAGVGPAWEALLGEEAVRERVREAYSRAAGDSLNVSGTLYEPPSITILTCNLCRATRCGTRIWPLRLCTGSSIEALLPPASSTTSFSLD